MEIVRRILIMAAFSYPVKNLYIPFRQLGILYKRICLAFIKSSHMPAPSSAGIQKRPVSIFTRRKNKQNSSYTFSGCDSTIIWKFFKRQISHLLDIGFPFIFLSIGQFSVSEEELLQKIAIVHQQGIIVAEALLIGHPLDPHGDRFDDLSVPAKVMEDLVLKITCHSLQKKLPLVRAVARGGKP